MELAKSFRTDEEIEKELWCLEAQEMRRLRGSEQWLEAFKASIEGYEVLGPGWEVEEVEEVVEGGEKGLESPKVMEEGPFGALLKA